MSDSISIKDTLTPELGQLAKKLQNSTAMMKAIGAAVAALGTRAFREEALRPSEWAPLAESTLKRKGSRGGPLIEHGTLMRSIRAENATGNTVDVVSDREYASYHQYGTKKMPARPFMPITPGDELTPLAQETVREIIEAHLGLEHK